MNTLIESYNLVLQKVKTLRDKIRDVEQEISNIKNRKEGDVPARIARLEEQLQKIDEYVLKIKGFQELAKKNLESQNVLTIEAPPGYRVNLNRLRNWAMLIDPTSDNDPYAQRVFVVAKCDECFLEKKRKEFTEKVALLRADEAVGLDEEMKKLEATVQNLRDDIKNYALSSDVIELSKQVVEENGKFWHQLAPTKYGNVQVQNKAYALGAYSAPLPFEESQREWLKTQFGQFFDEKNGRVLIPAELPFDKEQVVTITCAPVRGKELDRGLQNCVISLIEGSPAGTRKVYVLDGVRFNSSSMGSLKQLEGTFAFEQIPRNPEQMTAVLEQLVSSFSDMDEVLELHDSVAEYNAQTEPSKQLPYSTIILYGWPNSFEGRDRELLHRIMTNYERYGISFITISYRNADIKESEDKNPLPEYAMHNAVHINMFARETTITFPDSDPQRFVWYTFGGELSSDYVESLKANQRIKETIGNEYIKRYSLVERPSYTREYKKIELPFGIDGKDADHSVSFENENFATYLVGASRSGKSTLLHTLIAGLIRNYHPDNVELWLADFKQLEFKRYINHLPPHVKYVLLDESTELVYDLIDKLTNEMMERQKLFSRLGVQRIDQVNPMELDKPLPVIFVILDEFSIMSQSIADSPIYKLRLQNILAKGAALGIKFLFSSQTFTTGVAGLTATARAQIQQRIAMKGSKEEISETLELSSNLKTEQVRNWMDALPPHYALVKFRSGADTLPQVKRYLVMYFKDYAPRDTMIDQIRATMHPVESYNPSDIASYTDKHPVLVDGNSFNAFDIDGLSTFVSMKKNLASADYSGDEIFVTFGSPRLMERLKVSAISSETRENILLIARAAEQACAASIILSAIKSYQMQGGNVRVWAYEKNSLYRKYRDIFSEWGIETVLGIDKICEQIKSLKEKIISGDTGNELIVLIGMDRICIDFDYVSNEPKERDASYAVIENGAAKTEEDFRRLIIGNAFSKVWQPIEEQLTQEGKTQDEISVAKKERMRQFKKEYNYEEAQIKAKELADASNGVQSKSSSETDGRNEYNAKNDFDFVVKQGSRLGMHFLLSLTSLADLKSTGLKLEYFRYKMAFQLSVDDSRSLFNTRVASTLPEHICQFDDTLTSYSFRPYLHEKIEWDGWYVENGRVISPYGDS